MQPILLVMTGGTIGSILEKGIIRPDSHVDGALQIYRQQYGQEEQFETIALMNILSENLQKKHWEQLANYLLQTDLSRYSGVIVTHGSDTLSYTGAFLGVCMHKTACPIVLTAADKVPQHPQSNAADNLRTAVWLIRQQRPGVFTVYRNPGDSFCSIWLSAHVREADVVTGRFSSIDGRPLYRIEKDVLLPSEEPLQTVDEPPPPLSISAPLRLPYDVLLIQPYPGMDYRTIQLRESCRAVLHMTYHSSSASTQPDNSALWFLKKCRHKQIPFYLSSFPRDIDSVYETSHVLLQNGAVPLCHSTKETAYARLLLQVNTELNEQG